MVSCHQSNNPLSKYSATVTFLHFGINFPEAPKGCFQYIQMSIVTVPKS